MLAWNIIKESARIAAKKGNNSDMMTIKIMVENG